MGNGQPDDSRQIIHGQQPALSTTALVASRLDNTDLVLHIGDISYARGYASVVSTCRVSLYFPPSISFILSDV